MPAQQLIGLSEEDFSGSVGGMSASRGGVRRQTGRRRERRVWARELARSTLRLSCVQAMYL